MAGLSLKLKKKMTFYAYEVSPNGVPEKKGDSFEVMINPASLSLTAGICYCENKSLGNTGSEQKFVKSQPDKLSFEIVMDGTGVVNLPIPGVGSDDVTTQIKKLRAIVSRYQGEEHDINVVGLAWGKNKFFGKLDSMSIDYSLFKMNGDPLRAKVKLSFSEYLSTEEQIKKNAKSSPDMTHVIELTASDTLPALCQKIYGEGGWYLEVARINNLASFRNIPAGTRLLFPPLR